MIGYARVSTRQQSTDRQQADLLAADVRRDDLYVDITMCLGRELHDPSSIRVCMIARWLREVSDDTFATRGLGARVDIPLSANSSKRP